MKYKYAIIGSDQIKFTNNPTHHPLWARLIELKSYKIYQHKVIIEGLERQYETSMGVDDYNDVEDSEFEEVKFLWWKWRTFKSKGWHLLKKRIPVKLTFYNMQIIEVDVK